MEQLRDYSIGNPLEMLCVPPSDEEARRIRSNSTVNHETISTKNEITLEEAKDLGFSFVQVWGRKGSSPFSQIPCISTWLPWDRQSPMEKCAEDVIKHIGGEGVEIVWFGTRKAVGFFKGQQDLDGLMERLVEAPRRPYQGEDLSHLSRAVNELQDLRIKDILDPVTGSGVRWKEDFGAEVLEDDDWQRAHDTPQEHSLEWTYRQHGNEIWAKGIDGQPISLLTLALEAPDLFADNPDTATRDMLLAIRKHFLALDGENGFAIEFVFDKDAVCCADDVSCRYNEASAIALFESRGWDKGVVVYTNGERYDPKDYCQTCKKNKKEKKCVCQI